MAAEMAAIFYNSIPFYFFTIILLYCVLMQSNEKLCHISLSSFK